MTLRLYAYAFILCLAGCRRSAEKTFPQRETLSESVYASGVVKALDQYQAYVNAVGIVQDVFVKEGDSVSAGTPILSVYNESARIGRESAELARFHADRQANRTRLEGLETNIGLARSRWQNDSVLYERQKALYEQKVGTLVELEQRKLAFESARAAYVTARLQYQDLKRDINFNERSAGKNLSLSRALEGDLVLRSKLDGRVYALLKEKGEMVNAQTPLAVIGSRDNFLLEMKVDEYDIVKVAKGQTVWVSMDSYRGETFRAIVTRIYPIMDERSKSFTVEAEFVSPPPVLYPNLSLEANIVTRTRENTLTLPRSYLFRDTLVITTRHDTLPVKTGLKDYHKAEILGGIDESTEIIKPEL